MSVGDDGVGGDGPELIAPVSAAVERSDFLDDIVDGLSGERKSTPAKYLYDDRGSELFVEITRAADYYPTRVEGSIFESAGDEISGALGSGVTLIEPGAGDGAKAIGLIEMLDSPVAFVPIEISEGALSGAAERVAHAHNHVDLIPVRVDFTHADAVPDEVPSERRVMFFPGSTLGNFDAAGRAELFEHFAHIAGAGGRLLLGADLRKDIGVLLRAYDDSEGVTAAFNLNLLTRLNRELGADFDVSAFRHEARYNEEMHRVEMHLVSEREQGVSVGGRSFVFAAGESIHTESSYKFSVDELCEEAGAAGFTFERVWTDEKGWFSVTLFSC